MKGFATREGSIKVYCPGLVDKARTMDNQKEQAERLTQPIERLEQRAVVGLNDRAKQLIALQKRREECFLNLKKMSQLDCSLHGPNDFFLNWTLVDPKPKRARNAQCRKCNFISLTLEFLKPSTAPRLSRLSECLGLTTKCRAAGRGY